MYQEWSLKVLQDAANIDEIYTAEEIIKYMCSVRVGAHVAA